ncbi:ribosomal RNA small subunit methyltransferase NEP1-like protein [Trifolium pratense]|uniref:Ribosomal RNA small subunit methyltransferase NEP1-like protein n=1 Tax=Trifolium pratense TaxID=57577 RepID=A0A2K3MUJ0_TRIPR|nr:ribosomal RNA small subunit methyltransferase NEP1-like protein [Trifolium pratense]
MTRAYSVKGKKRKNKYVVEKYHRQEKEDEKQVQPKKQKITEENNNNELVGIPIAPPTENNSEKPSVIFILEKASLEVAKVGKTYQLLNSDDHADFLHNHNKNLNDYRPDLCHQALLHILDSPLNQAGRLKMVYIRTEKGVLIEVKPYERAPRTFKRFAGVMLELLQKSSISPAGKQLLRTIKYPVTQYLPINSRIVVLSITDCKDQPFVHILLCYSAIALLFENTCGAMEHGKIETDYTDDYIAVSRYPLSDAASCIARICNSIEGKWNIL